MELWSATDQLRRSLLSPFVRDDAVATPGSVKHASRSVVLARARRAETERRKAND